MTDFLISDSGVAVGVAAVLAVAAVAVAGRAARRGGMVPRSTGIAVLVASALGLFAAASAHSVALTVLALGATIGWGVVVAGSSTFGPREDDT